MHQTWNVILMQHESLLVAKLDNLGQRTLKQYFINALQKGKKKY